LRQLKQLQHSADACSQLAHASRSIRARASHVTQACTAAACAQDMTGASHIHA
jgi:hypothetical protein